MNDTAELPPIGWEHPSHFPPFYYAFNKGLTEEEKIWFYELCIAEFIHHFEKMEALSDITNKWISFYDPARFKKLRPLLRGHLEIKYGLEYILTRGRTRVSHTDLDIHSEEAMDMEDEYREMQYKGCVDGRHKIRRFLTEKVEKKAIWKHKYSDVLFAFYKYRIQANIPLKNMSEDKLSRLYSTLSKRFAFHQRNFDDFRWCFRKYVRAEGRAERTVADLIQRRNREMESAKVENPLFEESTYPHDVKPADIEKANETLAEKKLLNLQILMECLCFFMRSDLIDELFKIRYYVRHLKELSRLATGPQKEPIQKTNETS